MLGQDPSFYIFVASDVHAEGKTVGSIQAIKERLEKEYWALGERAPYLNEFKPGDTVVFYAAGSGKSVFVAKATIASRRLELPYEERQLLEGSHDYIFGAPYGVRLKEPVMFEAFVPVRDILRRLSFVGPNKKWGGYFQTSVIRATEADVNMILQLTKYTL